MFESRKPWVIVTLAVLAGAVVAGVAVAGDGPGGEVAPGERVLVLGAGAPAPDDVEEAGTRPARAGQLQVPSRVDRQALADVLGRLMDLRGLYFAGYFDDVEEGLSGVLTELGALQAALAAEPTSAALAFDGLMLWVQLASDEEDQALRAAQVAGLFPVGELRSEAHPPELRDALEEARAEMVRRHVVHPAACALEVNGMPHDGQHVPVGELPVALRLECPEGTSGITTVTGAGPDVWLVEGELAALVDVEQDGRVALRTTDATEAVAHARLLLAALGLDRVRLVPAGMADIRCSVGATAAQTDCLWEAGGTMADAPGPEEGPVDEDLGESSVAPAAHPVVELTAEEDGPQGRRPGPAGISLLVATGISAGVASGLMVREFQHHDRFTTCRDDLACRQDADRVGTYEEEWEAARTRSRVGWGLTAGLAVGTVAVLLLERPETRRQQREARLTIAPGPGDVGAALRLGWP